MYKYYSIISGATQENEKAQSLNFLMVCRLQII